MPAATATVVYVGGHDVVEFEIAPGVWRDVEQGESIEVPAALAARMLEQVDVWQTPAAKPKPAKKAAAKKRASMPDPEPAADAAPPDTE